MAVTKVNLPHTVNSILVVCPRRIGDVFCATPVVRSLKAAFAGTAIDMLVFEGTEGIIAENPDLRSVLTIPERPTWTQHVSFYQALWNRYDLAVSVQASDRSTLYAWASSKTSVGIVPDKANAWWKRKLLSGWVLLDNLGTHTVSMNLRLLELLGVKPLASPVLGWSGGDQDIVKSFVPPTLAQKGYAVLHVSPKFVYKQWTVTGWVELAKWLERQALTVVLTAGDSDEDRECLSSLLPHVSKDYVNLAGKLSLSSMSCLLNGATLYIGTDTAVTHMAAALGTPTVALFGPSNPVKWGPWPQSFPAGNSSPWKMRGSQRQGNVFLLQGEGDCVPCLGEGCERHIKSLSMCLQNLPAHRVIEAAQVLLTEQKQATESSGRPVIQSRIAGVQKTL